LAQINPVIGDLLGNTSKILDGIKRAKNTLADLVLFPELALTGYPPDDFLLLSHFIDALTAPLEEIRKASEGLVVVVGTPRRSNTGFGHPLHNSAAIFRDGKFLGYQDKCLLPTYDVFDERRYFEPGGTIKLWDLCGKKVGITICEDIWQHSDLLSQTSYARDPVLELRDQKPDLVLNLSASPYSIDKFRNRLTTCAKAAVTLQCPFVLCNQVGGNDGIIFDGRSLCMDKTGELLHCGKGFEEDFMLVDLTENEKSITITENSIGDLYQALVLGVRDYFGKSGFSRACLGLSGGIDSALVACIAVEALGKYNVLGVAMPSRFSSESSIQDAQQLATALGIECKEIAIEAPFESYLTLLTPHFQGKALDVTEENLQARIRGMILMALSNKLGYIALSTGNKSELAMGYSTLYGDMCGGLGVISDVSKRQVYALAHWINRDREIIPLSTIQKAPSAELRPNQKDSDSLPDYDIIDNVLQGYVEEHRSPAEIADIYHYPLELVNDLILRIHRSEYKRRQSAPGLRVTEKAFSVGRRFPIVQGWV
jgi:NAD+ synthase (glutamine-hydrolysing)